MSYNTIQLLNTLQPYKLSTGHLDDRIRNTTQHEGMKDNPKQMMITQHPGESAKIIGHDQNVAS